MVNVKGENMQKEQDGEGVGEGAGTGEQREGAKERE
jgi:hypothetical protein